MTEKLEKRFKNEKHAILGDILLKMDDFSRLSAFPMFAPVIRDFSNPEFIDHSWYRKYRIAGLVWGFPVIVVLFAKDKDNPPMFVLSFLIYLTQLIISFAIAAKFIAYIFTDRNFQFMMALLFSFLFVFVSTAAASIYELSKEADHLLISPSSETIRVFNFLDAVAEFIPLSGENQKSDILSGLLGNREFLDKLNILYQILPDGEIDKDFIERQCTIMGIGEYSQVLSEHKAKLREMETLKAQLSDIKKILSKSKGESESTIDIALCLSESGVEEQSADTLKSINAKLRELQQEYWQHPLSSDNLKMEIVRVLEG